MSLVCLCVVVSEGFPLPAVIGSYILPTGQICIEAHIYQNRRMQDVIGHACLAEL